MIRQAKYKEINEAKLELKPEFENAPAMMKPYLTNHQPNSAQLQLLSVLSHLNTTAQRIIIKAKMGRVLYLPSPSRI